MPDHYFAEAAAVLRRNEMHERFDRARIQAALGRLLHTPVRRVSVKPIVPEAWLLRHNVTIADALYVVVARHLDTALVTTDLRLAKAPGLPVATIIP